MSDFRPPPSEVIDGDEDAPTAPFSRASQAPPTRTGAPPPECIAALEGQWVGRCYKVLERVATGGSAVVYRAQHPVLEKHVALKVLRHDLGEHAAAFQRALLAGAQLSSELSSPYIVRTLDHGCDQRPDGDLHFIVEEFVEGQTLASMLQQMGPLGLAAGVGIARDICRGLAAAHTAGLVHRDLKPTNVLLTAQGRARLIDFGLARRSDRTTSPHGASAGPPTHELGSPRYVAPEQAAGQTAGERADIYSLGVVLFRMLTGSTPFAKVPAHRVPFMAATRPSPGIPSAAGRPIPETLQAIVQLCLRGDPEVRWPDAISLDAALGEVLEELSGRTTV